MAWDRALLRGQPALCWALLPLPTSAASLHFTDVDTGAQGGRAIGTGSHHELGAGTGFEPWFPCQLNGGGGA